MLRRIVLFGIVICFGYCLTLIFPWPDMPDPAHSTPHMQKIASVVGNDTHDFIEQKAVILSPDKSQVVVIQYFVDRWFLGGTSGIQIWLGQSAAHPRSYNLIFRAGEAWPAVEWADEQHLTFTFGTLIPSNISLPLIPEPPLVARRSAGDVKILYRVAGGFSERSYRKSLQSWEQRVRETSYKVLPINLRYDTMEYTRSHYRSAYNSAQEFWVKYLKFRAWLLADEESPLRNSRALENISYDVADVFPSPDGGHVARILPDHSENSLNDSASYSVIIGRSDGSREQDTVAFSALDGAPTVTWIDDSNLIITIQHLSRIQTSLHRVGTVAISYSLAERLRETKFRGDLSRWRQREEESERKRPTGRSLEANIDELERRMQQQLTHYAQFQSWALTNIPDGER